ncbi:MAG: ATP-binding protein, partial [Christensenellales bacterium]|nr:ATP-binding protein [Christensenellales bacterium]
VVVNFGADRCWALGDVRRINQVVSNFVDNALKFMPEKDGILTISTRQIDQNILFSIQDNGAGISSEDLPHIFERFYKADKAHTSGMGTGLGLSICNLIIRQHNSEINVRSRPGATVFEFLLPAADPPQPIMLGESAEDSAQT